jgi:hypothetical protein
VTISIFSHIMKTIQLLSLLVDSCERCCLCWRFWFHHDSQTTSQSIKAAEIVTILVAPKKKGTENTCCRMEFLQHLSLVWVGDIQKSHFSSQPCQVSLVSAKAFISEKKGPLGDEAENHNSMAFASPSIHVIIHLFIYASVYLCILSTNYLLMIY